ncbi:MAG: hypothetical protein IPN38_04065 [Flavobacteriales bacterium]|nr:hypothetical protein [Flavobacteriales bacterium]
MGEQRQLDTGSRSPLPRRAPSASCSSTPSWPGPPINNLQYELQIDDIRVSPQVSAITTLADCSAAADDRLV